MKLDKISTGAVAAVVTGQAGISKASAVGVSSTTMTRGPGGGKHRAVDLSASKTETQSAETENIPLSDQDQGRNVRRFLQRASRKIQAIEEDVSSTSARTLRNRHRRRRNLSMKTFFPDEYSSSSASTIQNAPEIDLKPCSPISTHEADVGILVNYVCEEDENMGCEWSEDMDGFYCAYSEQEGYADNSQLRSRKLEDASYDDNPCTYSDDYDYDNYTGTSTCVYDRGCNLYVDGYCHSLEIQYVVEDGYDLAVSFCYTFHHQFDASNTNEICIGSANRGGTCAVKVDNQNCRACFMTPNPEADDGSPCVSAVLGIFASVLCVCSSRPSNLLAFASFSTSDRL